MKRVRYLTAGESHGPGLLGIIEGLPAGIPVSADDIDRHLARRQKGYGRGGRMKIEQDRARITAGIRWGKTLGSPIGLLIENRDHGNWGAGMSAEAGHAGSIDPVTRPRPGHADLVGALKYDHDDCRNVLERSSARETAMKVALGAVAGKFLDELGIQILGWVREIGGVGLAEDPGDVDEAFGRAEDSDVSCPDEEVAARMRERIDSAQKEGYSLGGVFQVIVNGLPVGLGSYVHGDRRLGSRIAREIMAIQAIKGVEFGLGFETSRRPGNEVLDEIFHEDEKGFFRETNRSGGLEGGMTTGMPLVIKAAMKPIPTQRKPLRSVDIRTKEPLEAAYERSDVCAVPAAAVVGEAAVALVLADAILEKFGGDSLGEVRRNIESYEKYTKSR